MRAVVLDLGGGTFDVTVLEIIEGVIEIQSSSGDSRLGGEDFDEALAERFAARAKSDKGFDLRHDPRAWARLREASEGAKKRLTEGEAAGIALVDLPLGSGKLGQLELTLSRDEAEEIWAPLLSRIRAPILRALRDASLSPPMIDEVLLVGGSTRMPCVARLAAQLFGRLPLRKLPPDEAVAMGAAVQAALKQGDAAVSDMVVTDVAPFSLGIATATHLGRQQVSGLFSPILERGTVIPASRVQRFYTMGEMQREIRVEIFQGEHSLCRDNTRLGDYTVKDLSASTTGEQAVDVRFTHDLNGILEVEMTVVATGKSESLVIEKAPRADDRGAGEGRARGDGAVQVSPARRAAQRRGARPRRRALRRALGPSARGARARAGAVACCARVAGRERDRALARAPHRPHLDAAAAVAATNRRFFKDFARVRDRRSFSRNLC